MEDAVTVQLTSHRLSSQSNSQLGHTLQKHAGIKLHDGEGVEITHFLSKPLLQAASNQVLTQNSLSLSWRLKMAGDLTSPLAPAWLEKSPWTLQELLSLVVYSSLSWHRPQLQHSISAPLKRCVKVLEMQPFLAG